jgi:hypothetical protein
MNPVESSLVVFGINRRLVEGVIVFFADLEELQPMRFASDEF